MPILKRSKDKLESRNCSLISLLPTMSKLMDKIILKRLSKYKKKNKIIIEQQFSFRERPKNS